MTENLAFYSAGLHVHGRAMQDGFDRVFFRKGLA